MLLQKGLYHRRRYLLRIADGRAATRLAVRAVAATATTVAHPIVWTWAVSWVRTDTCVDDGLDNVIPIEGRFLGYGRDVAYQPRRLRPSIRQVVAMKPAE